MQKSQLPLLPKSLTKIRVWTSFHIYPVVWVIINVTLAFINEKYNMFYIKFDADQGPLLLTWFNFNPSMDK